MTLPSIIWELSTANRAEFRTQEVLKEAQERKQSLSISSHSIGSP